MAINLRRTALRGAILSVCLVTLASCQRGGHTMFQVSGKVLNKDGSVPKAPVALVIFQPTKSTTAEIKKSASGPIGPDGSFTLSTRMPGDGVNKGEYNVTFTLCKSAVDAKPMVLEKYADPNETPYKNVVVDKDLTDLKYEIEPLPGTGG